MRESTWIKLFTVSACLTIGACGPGGRDRSGAGDDDGSGGDDGTGSNPGGGGGGDTCSEESKLVYTVDENYQLSQFAPMTKTFTPLGQLKCGNPLFDGNPFSMGIDRNTQAYVLYSSGKIFKVDTTDASLPCTDTGWKSTNELAFFGMGFSTTDAGGTTDSLFIAGGDTNMPDTGSNTVLAALDTSTMKSSDVGQVTGWPELTGNSNAELWGWFPDDTHPRVEQINKAGGAPVKTFNLDSLAGMPTAWAFAFWGGDYWIFLAKGNETSTTVYQIDGNDGTVKTTTKANGRTIVGAGVSTCAPVVIQ